MTEVAAKPTTVDALNAMTSYAEAKMRRDKVEFQKNQELYKIEQKYARELDALNEEMEAYGSVVLNYAEREKEELFENAKTVPFGVGKIQLKTNPPKLEILKGYDQDWVLDYLQGHHPACVRTKREPDKPAIMKHLKDKPEELAKAGLEIVQNTTLSIKLD